MNLGNVQYLNYLRRCNNKQLRMIETVTLNDLIHYNNAHFQQELMEVERDYQQIKPLMDPMEESPSDSVIQSLLKYSASI